MNRSRKLKFMEMIWEEESGEFTITTFDREDGTFNGQVTLNITYMFSVIRFMLSIFQSYVGRGRHERVKNQKSKEGDEEVVQEAVGHILQPEGEE